MSNERVRGPLREESAAPDPHGGGDDHAVRKQQGEPAKRHGDALLEGNGSRQGEDGSATDVREDS